MSIASTSPSRGRGRPSIVDVMDISEAAIALWHERGYATTGWKELAEVTGVSARTLMRHFSSRAEIAWLGVAPAIERMRAAAPSIPHGIPLNNALRQLLGASVSRDPKVAALGPDFIELVTNEPEIAALASASHNVWLLAVADFIADRDPAMPPVIAAAIAAAYQSALFSALTEWASNPEVGEAADVVDAMLAYLGPLA